MLNKKINLKLIKYQINKMKLIFFQNHKGKEIKEKLDKNLDQLKTKNN